MTDPHGQYPSTRCGCSYCVSESRWKARRHMTGDVLRFWLQEEQMALPLIDVLLVKSERTTDG